MRRIKPALGKASSSFPMLVVEEEAWSGDRMTFRVRVLGQVAAGAVDVADHHVQLQVTLPWLLHKFAQVVQQTIAGRGRTLLEENNWRTFRDNNPETRPDRLKRSGTTNLRAESEVH